MSLPRLLVFLALCAIAFAAPPGASAQTPKAAPRIYGAVDSGHYNVSVAGRPIGFEVFTFTIHFDSLFIESEFRQALADGDTLRKYQMLVVRHFDNDLILYKSVITLPGRARMLRGITLGDTVITMFREDEEGGEGITIPRPGGRLFAVEPNGYALLDLLFREMATRKDWEQRPVNLILLGPDTVLTSTARSLGAQTVRWGGATMEARKYSVTVGPSVFYGWIGPKGNMLRLEQPELGLIVEREPPPAKSAPRKSAGASKPAPKSAPPKPPQSGS